MLAHLPLALDPVAPSDDARQAFMARVEADLTAAPGPAPHGEVHEFPVPPAPTPQPARAPWWQPVAAAVAAAAITWLAVSMPLRQRQEQLSDEVATQAVRIQELEQAVQDANGQLQVLRSPEMLMVSVTGTESQSGASGRILWNRESDVWHLAVRGMSEADTGKTYQLWYVTAEEEKISAGTFEVGPDGTATELFRVPEGIGAIVLAAVTDEPAGGSPQPTGSFQLLGEVPQPQT